MNGYHQILTFKNSCENKIRGINQYIFQLIIKLRNKN